MTSTVLDSEKGVWLSNQSSLGWPFNGNFQCTALASPGMPYSVESSGAQPYPALGCSIQWKVPVHSPIQPWDAQFNGKFRIMSASILFSPSFFHYQGTKLFPSRINITLLQLWLVPSSMHPHTYTWLFLFY